MPVKKAMQSAVAAPLVVAGLLVGLLCSVSLARNASWRDEAAFLEDLVRKSPEAVGARQPRLRL